MGVSSESFSGYSKSELVIGLVGAVGTDLDGVIKVFSDRLRGFSYEAQTVHISEQIIKKIAAVKRYSKTDKAARINALMDAGNEARRLTGDNAILAFGVAARISQERDKPLEPKARSAFLIRSLKHPDEIHALRDIYGDGFYVVGVYEEKDLRTKHLIEDDQISLPKAKKLVERDEDEHMEFGQRTRDTFQLADFFVDAGAPEEHRKNCVQRILDILFGQVYNTPTFDEFAMFMAFSSALRSADLSRQVGAVIARDDEILSMGANDCPKFGGGLYWPTMNYKGVVADAPKGRDHTRGCDSNKIEKDKIVDDILGSVSDFLKEGVDEAVVKHSIARSSINDITEYGRVVHAEMEAILSCARQNMSTRGATLYCTTFPCHNCAKHIVASGIRRVVYVEPYPKSKALQFHDDSIKLDLTTSGKRTTSKTKVLFEPFVGIGARRFAELFSIHTGSGKPLRRKDAEGKTLTIARKSAKLRVQMLPVSYLEKELEASNIFLNHIR